MMFFCGLWLEWHSSYSSQIDGVVRLATKHCKTGTKPTKPVDCHILRDFSRDPGPCGTPTYHSHTSRDSSYGSGMGVVWVGVPRPWGSLEFPLNVDVSKTDKNGTTNK